MEQTTPQTREVGEQAKRAIVKEFLDKRVVFRTRTYAHGLDHVLYMFEEAKKDFPSLETDEVEVVLYDGDRIRGITGIEFDVQNASDIPSDYTKLAVLHPTR